MSQKKAVARQITVIARFFIKKSGVSNGVSYKAGDVVLLVRNDKGVEYYTTIRANGVHSCSCPAKKTCYHITQCSTIEGAREAAAEKALAVLALAKEVEAICVEAERETTRSHVPTRELAPLNGNRPFSLLRVA